MVKMGAQTQNIFFNISYDVSFLRYLHLHYAFGRHFYLKKCIYTFSSVFAVLLGKKSKIKVKKNRYLKYYIKH